MTRWLVALALVACTHRDEPIAVPPSATAKPVLTAATTQLVSGIVSDWTSTKVELRLWQRDAAGWHAVGDPWPAVVGYNGTAWGAGLHGDGSPSGRGGPIKREGDGKSPAGVFAIDAAYGYAAQPPPGTQMPYTPLDDGWRCVDDPASQHYATVLDQRTVSVDWKSAEEMRRNDPLYTWVLNVAHNTRHRPGAGSCIFLHVWEDPDGKTLGCTAMAEPELSRLLARLDPQRAPVFVLLPRGEYDALASAWGLPAR